MQNSSAKRKSSAYSQSHTSYDLTGVVMTTKRIPMVVLLLSLTLVGNAAQAANSFLHVLLVMDTNDESIGRGCQTGLDLLSEVLGEIRDGREDKMKVWALKGEDATPERVLAAVSNIGVKPDHALLVFYAGHGGMTERSEHYLIPNNKVLYRDALREEMDRTGAALQVLLTDCCSNVFGVEPPNRRIPAEWQVFKQLFFESEGVIDVTAAQPGTFSWTSNAGKDEGGGGFFTRAFANLLCKAADVVDDDGDDRVTWNEFVDRLNADTSEVFKVAREAAGDGAQIKRYEDQRPYSFVDSFFSSIGYREDLAADYLRWFERHWSQLPFGRGIETVDDAQVLLDQAKPALALIARAKRAQEDALRIAQGLNTPYASEAAQTLERIRRRENDAFSIFTVQLGIVEVKERLRRQQR